MRTEFSDRFVSFRDLCVQCAVWLFLQNDSMYVRWRISCFRKLEFLSVCNCREGFMKDSKFEKCLKMMRQLVSDIQGAPYPSDDLAPDLYRIWYEHVQRVGVECLEYLDDNFPLEQEDISSTLNRFFK